MAVKRLGYVQGNDTSLKLMKFADSEEYSGLTADTLAWLAAHTDLVDGSTYRELDGQHRMYEIQSGTWYEQ